MRRSRAAMLGESLGPMGIRQLRWLSLSICMGILALAAGLSLAKAETISGQATVVDGDTLTVSGQRIRLWGIDAPESAQQCDRETKPYPCGSDATKHLAALIQAGPVSCTVRTYDRYKRAVALCMSGSKDISAEMVRVGWALAFVRYSADYVGQEQDAKANKRGMWSGSFAPPWDWRATKR